ncbi:hypothetical protein EJ05DRAFT_542525, partial [Pseudovirgaria hyperparasitica]
MFLAHSDPYWSVFSKKRSFRAQQACKNCRLRKQKCVENRPCLFCKEQNIECEYAEVPPRKPDKLFQLVMQKLNAIQENGEQIEASLNRRLERLENSPCANGTHSPPAPTHHPQQHQHQDQQQHQQQHQYRRELNDFNEHRTAAHYLLKTWPAMAKYFNSIVPLLENYPLKIEEERGSLRIYGRGEGLTHNDRAQQVGSRAGSQADSETMSLSSTSDSGQAPYRYIDKVNRLDLTPTAVNRLLASYLDHMHVLHPFLDKARLKKQVDAFVDRMNPPASTKSPLSMPQHLSEHHRPTKRQRTDIDEGEPTAVPIYARPAQSHVRPPKAERTITNAIILLVLALGAVLHEDAPIGGVLDPRKEI